MKPKKTVAAVLQRNSRLLTALVLLSSTYTSADPVTESATTPSSSQLQPTSPTEGLRAKLFSSSSNQISCRILNRGIGRAAADVDASLQVVIDKIIDGIQNERHRVLIPLFHDRLKVSNEKVQNIFATHQSTYGGRRLSDVSVFRLWALNTVDGEPGLIACPDDELSVRAQYGYPLQFGLWLQVTGERELGRIFITLVPVGEEWRIGVWHNQQWTHMGKDAETWVEEALKHREQGNRHAAYVKLDLAYKLLDSGAFVHSQFRLDVKATRDALFSDQDWLQELQKAAAGESFVYAGTILADDGAGVLFRRIVDPNEASDQMRQDCMKTMQKIYQHRWTHPLGGSKCSMIAPQEDHHKDGRLGSVFFEKKDIQNPDFKP